MLKNRAWDGSWIQTGSSGSRTCALQQFQVSLTEKTVDLINRAAPLTMQHIDFGVAEGADQLLDRRHSFEVPRCVYH